MINQKETEIYKRFHDLVENLSVGVYRNTPGAGGHFLEANSAMLSMFEADSKKEFLQHNVSYLYQNPQERKEFVAEMLKKGEVKNRLINLVTLKGKIFVGAITAVMKKDPQGNIFFDGIVENVSEIAKNKELENTKKALLNVVTDINAEKTKVEELNAKNEAIIRSIADGLIITDEKGLITRVNEEFEKLLGYQTEEVLGKDMLDVVVKVDENGETIPRQKRSLSRVLSGELKTGRESTLITTHCYIKKDGCKMPVIGVVAPIILNKKTIGAIQLFRDVTREKEFEKMKDEFMDIAAHDLRTPAAAIRGFISRVLDGDAGKISDKARDLLKEAYEGNMRSIKLVDDFLVVSRLERGKIQIHPRTGDLAKVIITSIHELLDLAKTKDLTLEYKKINLPPVLVDEERVIQVVNNLIGNAIKFTDKGRISVWHEINKDKVITNITDTGIGISQATQKQLFQKYYKGKENTNRSGLGLGLYISRLCIEGLGGQIWVNSKEGKGSTFSFSLPIAK